MSTEYGMDPTEFIGTNREPAWMPSRVTRNHREIWMMGLIQYMNLDDIASRATSYEEFQEIQGVRVMIDRKLKLTGGRHL